MRILISAVLVLSLGAESLHAQLLVSSRVQIENTGSRPRFSSVGLWTELFAGFQAPKAKVRLDVLMWVGPDAVRIEGFGPALGYPAHMVMLGRAGKSPVWIDSATRTYFERPAIPLKFYLKPLPAVRSKPDGGAVLLGRPTSRTRDEIVTRVPFAMDVPIFEEEPSDLTEIKMVLQTWRTKDFVAEGRLASTSGLYSQLINAFGIPVVDGLPLRQLLQLTGSNGEGLRWDTTVLSIRQDPAAPDAFSIPPGYQRISSPVPRFGRR